MRSVLVVDQMPHTADLMVKYLRVDGYAVDHTPDPSEAIELADRSHYGVVVTDLFMTGISGFDLYREITLHTRIPFVFLVKPYGEELRLFGSLDRKDVIKKEPLSINEVITKVRAAFTNSH